MGGRDYRTETGGRGSRVNREAGAYTIMKLTFLVISPVELAVLHNLYGETGIGTETYW